MQRLLAQKAVDGLREASRRSVVQGGGPERFQYVTRVTQGQLSKCWTHDPSRKTQLVMAIDVAVEADLEAGAPVIVGEMARLQGYRLVRDDGADSAAGGLGIADIGAFQDAFHALSQSMIQAVADGKVDPREAAEILEKYANFMRVAHTVESKTHGCDGEV
ncbi:hypothetical protein [Martelella sp.]|mgnify:CR=1 FL=1|uniref:hypothetical protein n=1 Tax=Martelella sp. TaxID=1969699 RepID=UPI0025B9AC7D|nr:hypothetical protein [Martelella sp.]|tara:strand:- start:425 stop:907 length:483 start_codon:yes stop_codon:yes gene_type:complete